MYIQISWRWLFLRPFLQCTLHTLTILLGHVFCSDAWSVHPPECCIVHCLKLRDFQSCVFGRSSVALQACCSFSTLHSHIHQSNPFHCKPRYVSPMHFLRISWHSICTFLRESHETRTHVYTVCAWQPYALQRAQLSRDLLPLSMQTYIDAEMLPYCVAHFSYAGPTSEQQWYRICSHAHTHTITALHYAPQ